MKACLLKEKQNLVFTDVDEPVLLGAEEVKLRIIRAGICGSDMHYFKEGCVGAAIVVKHPFILGHEAVGKICEIGGDVKNLAIGDLVVVRPSRPCFDCELCNNNMHTYCTNLTHSGSASTMPHTDGLFAEYSVIHRSQAIPAKNCSPKKAVFAEPLAVAINSVKRISSVVGKNILIMGAGPIGVLCATVAKHFGAKSVTVLDIRSQTLEAALQMGVDLALNSLECKDQIDLWKKKKGYFDHMIEASGSGNALAEGMSMCKPESTCVQVGVFPPNGQPQNLGPFLTKGIRWVGVFRCYEEFSTAINMLDLGYIDPQPLLSSEFLAKDCVSAMECAFHPSSIKVQLIFD